MESEGVGRSRWSRKELVGVERSREESGGVKRSREELGGVAGDDGVGSSRVESNGDGGVGRSR